MCSSDLSVQDICPVLQAQGTGQATCGLSQLSSNVVLHRSPSAELLGIQGDDHQVPRRRSGGGAGHAGWQRLVRNRTAMPWTTRLVGRSAEAAELERQYKRAAEGEFRSVVVLADPGIGNTRLAREFLRADVAEQLPFLRAPSRPAAGGLRTLRCAGRLAIASAR